MTQSKTMAALDAIESGAMTVAQAARKFEISAAAIYAAQRRRAGKQICPCCGQVVRAGFEVKSDAAGSVSVENQ